MTRLDMILQAEGKGGHKITHMTGVTLFVVRGNHVTFHRGNTLHLVGAVITLDQLNFVLLLLVALELVPTIRREGAHLAELAVVVLFHRAFAGTVLSQLFVNISVDGRGSVCGAGGNLIVLRFNVVFVFVRWKIVKLLFIIYFLFLLIFQRSLIFVY